MYFRISTNRLHFNAMALCHLCSGLDVAHWVPEYHGANEEYPSDSTRYPHQPSFEDLEQAAADWM